MKAVQLAWPIMQAGKRLSNVPFLKWLIYPFFMRPLMKRLRICTRLLGRGWSLSSDMCRRTIRSGMFPKTGRSPRFVSAAPAAARISTITAIFRPKLKPAFIAFTGDGRRGSGPMHRLRQMRRGMLGRRRCSRRRKIPDRPRSVQDVRRLRAGVPAAGDLRFRGEYRGHGQRPSEANQPRCWGAAGRILSGAEGAAGRGRFV